MQYEITDKAAIEFSRAFYDAVADGLPVDAAVAEARTAIKMRSTLEWGTPVLYMRSSDGRIFDVPTEPLAVKPPSGKVGMWKRRMRLVGTAKPWNRLGRTESCPRTTRRG
jgi:hypothetical protein